MAFNTNMALSNVPNIDAIIDGFHKKPTKIMGTPTFNTLNQLKLNLQDNTSLVPSNLGGAQNCYLGLILAAPAYHTIVGNDANGNPQPFIAPTFPGPVLTITGINEVAREAKLQKFEADTYTWRKYDNMGKALQKHIIAPVDISRPRRTGPQVTTR
jgi:hypothetical protein